MDEVKTKNLAKGLGARYGRKIRKRLSDIFELKRAKYKCPYCLKLGVKRVASGIWYCKKCKSKFTAGAYSLVREIKE